MFYKKKTDKDESNVKVNPMNKILDDYYIFRTEINSKYISQPSLMNIYQFGILDDPKTFATFKLLEIIMDIQFSKNDLVGINIDSIQDFEQSLIVVDGELIVKFFKCL